MTCRCDDCNYARDCGLPVPHMGFPTLAEYESLQQRIAELEAEIGGVCTCGSGGHPRECKRHPDRYRLHVAEWNNEIKDDEIEALTAALKTAREGIQEAVCMLPENPRGARRHLKAALQAIDKADGNG